MKGLGTVFLTSLIVIFIITLMFTFPVSVPGVFAQVNDTSNVTVNITVSLVAEITVNPINFTVPSLAPGAQSGSFNFSIKNTGSSNITNLFTWVDTIVQENTSPIGLGDPNLYAATGFVFIRNASGETQHFHAGRLEWNLSSVLQGEILNLTDAQNFSHGWYYNGSNTYLWKAENGTASDNATGFCNVSGSNFAIQGHPENSTSGLKRDFSSGIIIEATFEEGTHDWGLFSFTEGPLDNHCVAVNTNCTKAYFYKYDKRGTAPSSDFNGCTQSQYMRPAILTPGESTFFTLFAAVPEGTPFGQTAFGTLTVAGT